MRRAAVLAAAALLAAAPAALVATARAQESPRERQGERLYLALCASCHGTDGLGTAQGPSLAEHSPAGVDLQLTTGRMPLADPSQQPVRTDPRLTPDQIAAITQYLAARFPGGEPIPVVEPQRGDLVRGRQLYSANCLACHGAGVQGGAIGGGRVAPSLHPSTPVQIAEAVRVGPGVMPRFGESTIDDRALDALIRYVLFVKEAETPGGFSLGFLGPVAEGLVAWLVGLGLIYGVLRLGGTQS